MTSATPKPRAGEHTIERWNGWELERDDKGPFVQVRDYEALRAERDVLSAQVKDLREALEAVVDSVTPKAEREAIESARAILAKHGR